MKTSVVLLTISIPHVPTASKTVASIFYILIDIPSHIIHPYDTYTLS